MSPENSQSKRKKIKNKTIIRKNKDREKVELSIAGLKENQNFNQNKGRKIKKLRRVKKMKKDKKKVSFYII